MAGRSAKHTAFRGWVGESTAKWRALVWGDDASSGAGPLSKIRIRASDGYAKTSAWVTSSAFTVTENAAPTITLVSPSDEGTAAGNTPAITFAVADGDLDAVHVELYLSLRSDFGSGFHIFSSVSQDNWTESADPYSSWTELPSGGATTGNRVRWQAPPLRYDIYYLKYRAYDGILYSAWSDPIWFRVTPSGGAFLTCTVGSYTYSIIGLNVTERTGGEASPITFRVPLSALATQPITKGDGVSIGLNIGEQSRVWNGTVEALVSSGAEVTVSCVQDDAYLARKLVTADSTSDDVGSILATWVTNYGAPLANNHMDTSLGVTTAVKGEYKSLLEHLREWASLLGLILFVDSDGDVHLTDPDDLPDPSYVLYEGY